GRPAGDSGIDRYHLFVTTKCYPGGEDPAREAEGSLRRLGVDYVDLYIVHWPAGGPTWAWPGMEQAKERGYARSIGVSNFNVDEIREVTAAADLAPAVNQVQFGPFAYRQALLEECRARGVVLEAYSTLGTGRHLSEPAVTAIAERLGRTPAQILL